MDIQKQDLKAGLYIIATPIGNLRDITLRALDTAASVDVVYCEDTRVSGKLLAHYGIKAKLHSYNDHNADDKRGGIIKRIQGGDAVALISDAGMPLISDPGYKLVRDAADAGVYVTTIPGANAPLSALQLSGLPSDNFTFIGFLPTKAGARDAVLQKWKSAPSTLIVFESANRLSKTLSAIYEIMGAREVAVVREITKMFEESRRDSIENLIEYYTQNGAPKGEIVLVIEAQSQDTALNQSDVDAMILDALKTVKTKEAAALVAQKTSLPKKDIYARALELKNE